MTNTDATKVYAGSRAETTRKSEPIKGDLCAAEEFQGVGAEEIGANQLDDLAPRLADLEHFDPWAKRFDPMS